ncbi:SpoIIE family protein phosphatase [Brevifollis gellanilyticus]|nr:SpoIIE family protein phosphatase [Brevifollis gellanilyticus]
MPDSLHLTVRERSQAGEARRLALSWAADNGCSPDQQAKVALVISELANNLALHTTDGGHLLLRMLDDGGPDAVEILSLDQGPGSANFGACMRDGYSTAGTAGTGLGAVQRASEYFETFSQLGTGTVILSQLCPNKPMGIRRHQFGLTNVPIKGEVVCGDAGGYLDLGGGRFRFIVADGLGHGPCAADASQAALKVFKEHPKADLPTLMQNIHGALRATRGAAVALVEVDSSAGTVSYLGVGNIASSLVRHDGSASHLVSSNGTVGVVLPRLQPFSYTWSAETLLVMTSDGVKNHWRLDKYAGLMNRHPSLIAGVLFRDHSRKTDDTTAAVFRICT